MNNDADPSSWRNNPYAEGGRPPSSVSESSYYWCYGCSSKVLPSQVLRVPDLTCPRCHSTFLEEARDDDPNAPGQNLGFFAGEDEHVLPLGDTGFAGLFQQLMGAMQGEGMYEDARENAHSPPVPSRSENPSGSRSNSRSHTPSARASSPSSQAPPGLNRQPSQPQSPSASVPIRNLASFLNEAFAPGERSNQQSGTYNRQGQDASTPPSGRASSPHAHAPQDDIFTSMMGALARAAGAPFTEEQDPRQSTSAPNQPRPGPFGSRMMFTNDNGRTGMAFTWTSGGGGGSSTAQNRGPTPVNAGMPLPFPFAMFMGGEGSDGQMGDYVFSQNAMDNIISDLLNQAAGRNGPQRAPQEMIDALPTLKMTKDLLKSDEIADCAVCKDDFEEGNDVLKLPCAHIFHPDCIKPWLERSGTCPVCRYALVEQPSSVPTSAGPDFPFNPAGSQNPSSPSHLSPPVEGGSRIPRGLTSSFPFNLFRRRSSQSPSSSNQNPTSSRSRASNTNEQSARQEEQGQPDLDLDLD